MKTIAYILFLSLITSVHSAETGDGWSSLSPTLPSCSLYRHRLADYFQRIQEVNIALKLKQRTLTNHELNNIQNLWDRTDQPLLHKEFVTWKKTLDLTTKAFNKEDVESVHIQSEVFEWDHPKFEFPEEIFRLAETMDQQLTIEFEMPYMQSCLVVKQLSLVLKMKDGRELVWNFDLKR